MLPIYSDLLKMWSDLGYDLPIKEGKYWLENNFIQAFTRDGTLRKLWKYKVFDDLHIEITPYHNKIKFLTYLCILLLMLTSSIRFLAISKYVLSNSIPIKLRLVFTHATPVEPLPIQLSRTTSFSSV